MASRSWNIVELIGNLTRDPELRYTPTGTAVATFSIATNRTYISDGEKKEEADFHRIVAWNKLAELCSQLLKKGNRVFVSGRLQNRTWEGQDGNQRNTTEIVIEDMILLTSKNGTGDYTAADTSEAELPSRQVESTPQAAVAEDLPEAVEEKAEQPEEAKKEEKPKTQKEDIEDIEDLPF